jgi:acyl carrier protein
MSSAIGNVSRVDDILITLLQLEEPVKWDEIQYQVTTDWDSLVHLGIVEELEARFKISISPEEVILMKNRDLIFELLRSKGIDVTP